MSLTNSIVSPVDATGLLDAPKFVVKKRNGVVSVEQDGQIIVLRPHQALALAVQLVAVSKGEVK